MPQHREGLTKGYTSVEVLQKLDRGLSGERALNAAINVDAVLDPHPIIRRHPWRKQRLFSQRQRQPLLLQGKFIL